MKPITGNLFFVGLMGAGKTTLGRHIAKTLDRPFYDSDHEICKCSGVSISTIFEVEGEQGFRSRETAMLKKTGRNEKYRSFYRRRSGIA